MGAIMDYKVGKSKRHDEHHVLGPPRNGIRPLVAKTIRRETAEKIVALLNGANLAKIDGIARYPESDV